MDIETETEVVAVVRRHRELGEVIADLVQQREDLKARFESLVPVGYETEVDGQPVYRKHPSRAFSLTIAVALCNELGHEVPVRWEHDADDAKAFLKSVDCLDDAMLPGKGSARVKI
jgi:hypothetical protein